MSASTILSRLWLAAAVCCGVGLLAAGAAADDAASALPRYRLKVGQELTYHQSSEFHYGEGDNAGTLGDKVDWQVWVVRHNDDGGWRLVLRSSERSWQTRGKEKPSEEPASSSLAYCDVTPDGRITANDSLGYRMHPRVLFPRLPKDEEALAQGWENFIPRDDTRSRFTLDRQDTTDSVWAFDEVREEPWDAIYLSSSRSRFFFDRKRGLIQRTESKSTQGYGFKGEGTGTGELGDVKEHDADWVKQFAAETERYFAANQSYHDLLTRAEKEKKVKEAEALLAKAETVLKGVRDQLTLPLLRDQVDEQLKNHAQSAKWALEDVRRFAEILDKPAAAWETKDLEGKPHALEGYRGKVVVLDFWYRGCGWCIRAMPQVNQLADDFKKEPVAVLGMNTDRNEKDAQFVVDKMKLTYPVLKAEGLPQKYKVQGFPTLIIIDQKGDVRDVHVGYSPTLREDVARRVRELLGKKES